MEPNCSEGAKRRLDAPATRPTGLSFRPKGPRVCSHAREGVEAQRLLHVRGAKRRHSLVAVGPTGLGIIDALTTPLRAWLLTGGPLGLTSSHYSFVRGVIGSNFFFASSALIPASSLASHASKSFTTSFSSLVSACVRSTCVCEGRPS